MAIGPGEQIASAHPQELEIRIWTPDGVLERRLGGHGEGPGEFSRLDKIGYDGITLWAMDLTQRRVTYFDSTGSDPQTQRFNVDRRGAPEDPVYGNPRPIWPVGDGTFYGMRSGQLPQMAGRDSIVILHLRLDSDSAILDTLFAVPFRLNDGLAVQTPSGQWLYGSQPFADAVLVATEAGQRGLVAVGRRAFDGRSDPTISVTRVDMDGDTVFHREIPYTPEPLASDLAERVVNGFVRRWQGELGEAGPPAAVLERMAQDALFVPDYVPPVSTVVLGRDGTIWMRSALPESSVMTWTVLNADGELCFSVDLPTDLRVMVADQHHVWGSRDDEIGVPYFERYRIGPRESEGELQLDERGGT
jgi:hypothetical protein